MINARRSADKTEVITRITMDVDDSGLLPDDTVDKEVGADDVVDIGSMSE